MKLGGKRNTLFQTALYATGYGTTPYNAEQDCIRDIKLTSKLQREYLGDTKKVEELQELFYGNKQQRASESI